jgi:hypothetical protein
VIAVAGLALTTLATVPLAFVPAETSLLAIEALQVGRGIGLALFGASAMAVVLTSVARHQLPDATAQVNILANVGSALGGALLVVILTNGLVAGARETASAAAFHTTFWWLTAVTLAGLLGAVRLLAVQHRAIKEEAS